MSKIRENFLKYWKGYLVTGIIAAILGVIIFLLYFFIKESAINGCTVAFACLLGVGLLWMVGNLGGFDSLAYGFKQFFHSNFGAKANKYNDYPGYLKEKQTIRSHSPRLYLSFIIVSFLFAIATLILYITLVK